MESCSALHAVQLMLVPKECKSLLSYFEGYQFFLTISVSESLHSMIDYRKLLHLNTSWYKIEDFMTLIEF